MRVKRRSQIATNDYKLTNSTSVKKQSVPYDYLNPAYFKCLGVFGIAFSLGHSGARDKSIWIGDEHIEIYLGPKERSGISELSKGLAIFEPISNAGATVHNTPKIRASFVFFLSRQIVATATIRYGQPVSFLDTRPM